MDLEGLIDEITELVLAQLERAGHSAGSVHAALPQTVIVMGEGERGGDQLAAHIRTALAAGCAVSLVPSALWPRTRIAHAATADGRVRVVDAPPAWEPLLAQARLVLVPNLAVRELASAVNLLGFTPASAALTAAIAEGVPVLAGADEVHRLTSRAARLPKGLVERLNAYVAAAAGMGIRLAESGRLPDEMAVAGAPRTASPTAASGRDVLTADDVERVLRSGASTIEVAPQTIITPLAREVAQAGGVDIVVG